MFGIGNFSSLRKYSAISVIAVVSAPFVVPSMLVYSNTSASTGVLPVRSPKPRSAPLAAEQP